MALFKLLTEGILGNKVGTSNKYSTLQLYFTFTSVNMRGLLRKMFSHT